MLFTALIALVLVQDTPTPEPETPPAETGSEAPAVPTDAPTLIADIEGRAAAYGELAAELAARKARERYLTGLVLPVISRTDLDDGARGEILQAFGPQIAAVEDANTQWAVDQLTPEDFAVLYAEEPRMAQDILRWAERAQTARPQIVAALEPVALNGDYDGLAFAQMADALAVSQEAPQSYGTALVCLSGETALAPVRAPEALAERREALGLPPLDPDAFVSEACGDEDAGPDDEQP